MVIFMVWFWIVTVLIAVLALMLFMPVRVKAVFAENEIVVKALGITVYSSVKSKAKKLKKDEGNDEEKAEHRTEKPDNMKFSLSDFQHKAGRLKLLYDEEKVALGIFFSRLKKLVTLIYYKISVTFGFDDPADTGMTTGVVCMVICGVEAYIRNYIEPKKKCSITITPEFVDPKFDIDGEIVLSVMFWNVIRTVKYGYDMYKRNIPKIKTILEGGNVNERTSDK